MPMSKKLGLIHLKIERTLANCRDQRDIFINATFFLHVFTFNFQANFFSSSKASKKIVAIPGLPDFSWNVCTIIQNGEKYTK
jgi:hypothetical protein